MNILIADDDSTSRLLLTTIASQQGHSCLQANDGSSAWQLMRNASVEVLLTDWMMPGLDGPELCRQVREEITDSYVYIVLVTGLGERDRVLEGMHAGADDYLVKPVDTFALQTRLIAAERVTTLHRQVAHFRAELERANLELLGQSLTDPLTGLGNRRRLERDLAAAHTRAELSARGYSLCLFDIDHFKLYNDHYGHPAGDWALRAVAQCLATSLRPGDEAYRYGGEEFLALLPDCDLTIASALARRASHAVAQMGIPHLVRPSPPPVVTLSAGVAEWDPCRSVGPAELIAGADRALYRAKSAGRNQVGFDAALGDATRRVMVDGL